MTDTRPTLYLSRLLPDPVMAIVRERFQLVQDPLDALPAPSALREGLCQADAAIVTLGDRIDAETIRAATRLKILANYAVGYNNIDLAAARAAWSDRHEYSGRLDGCHRGSDLGLAPGDGTPHRRRRCPRSIRSLDRVESHATLGSGSLGQDPGDYRHGTDRASGGPPRGRVSHAGALSHTPTSWPPRLSPVSGSTDHCKISSGKPIS